MEMKRIGKLIGLAVVAVVMMFAAAGCVSMSKDYGVYDKSVPKDQMSDFTFTAVIIKTFNGKPVDWGRAINYGTIKVPAGTHDFVFDWEWVETGSGSGGTVTTTTRTIQNLEISQFEFLPGRRYQLSGGWLNNRVMIAMGEIAKAPKKSKTPTVLEGNWKGADTTTFKFAGNTWEMSIPQGIPGNNVNGTIQRKGTFEIDGNNITMYLTHQGRNGLWVNVSGNPGSTGNPGVISRPYSLEGKNLNLGRSKAIAWTYSFNGNQAVLLNENLPPNIVYTKQ